MLSESVSGGSGDALTQAVCRGKEMWYNGYREQNMLVVFITLWCAVSYYAKVRSRNE